MAVDLRVVVPVLLQQADQPQIPVVVPVGGPLRRIAYLTGVQAGVRAGLGHLDALQSAVPARGVVRALPGMVGGDQSRCLGVALRSEVAMPFDQPRVKRMQALDAAGKDSTIKHVMSGVNPQGVTVRAFKQPSAEDLNHDFLWRHQCALPGRGSIGIFNRSHYEEVLVVRVHPDLLAAEHLPAAARKHDVWARRYREINNWERYLVGNGIQVVKIMLNVSKREQAKRFLQRIDHPDKNWKFSPSDVRERRHWEGYQQAFDSMLSQTSTRWAPWYVVPADHKWFSRLEPLRSW